MVSPLYCVVACRRASLTQKGLNSHQFSGLGTRQNKAFLLEGLFEGAAALQIPHMVGVACLVVSRTIKRGLRVSNTCSLCFHPHHARNILSVSLEASYFICLNARQRREDLATATRA